MLYVVKFEVDGDPVSYTVKADNVLQAEEAGKEELRLDAEISKKRGSEISTWKVKSIENVAEK